MSEGCGMTLAEINITPILSFLECALWGGLGGCAAYGLFCAVLLLRRVGQKRFPGQAAEEAFLDDIAERLEQNDYDGANAVCDKPELWSRAVPQLVQVALLNKERPLKKIRQILGERFERDVLANLEQTSSWVNTMVKSAPMLGLLG
ncbi:MAG: MotA/TolQ/ExbB proton channel family protein, partial [Planctomycetaceae bacterium]|nr:MotA/TolQ/ExbB proton channel family protein [Planctomycetaceae bacterium]